MGGGIGKGNVRPYAEFNMFCDPESAAFVLREADHLALIPLNTTETVAFSLMQIDRIGQCDTVLAHALYTILKANYAASTAVLYYLFPELFSVRKCGIHVNCEKEPGNTELTDRRHNIILAEQTDPALLLEKIMACVMKEYTPHG